MAVNEGHNGILPHSIGHVVPVVHVLRQHGYVGDQEDGLALRAVGLQLSLQPFDVLGIDMSQGHAHERSAAEAEEEESLVLELEPFVAEDAPEVEASALAPFQVVVALYNIIRNA